MNIEQNTKIAEILGWSLTPSEGWGFPPNECEPKEIPNFIKIINESLNWPENASVCHTCGGKGYTEN